MTSTVLSMQTKHVPIPKSAHLGCQTKPETIDDSECLDPAMSRNSEPKCAAPTIKPAQICSRHKNDTIESFFATAKTQEVVYSSIIDATLVVDAELFRLALLALCARISRLCELLQSFQHVNKKHAKTGSNNTKARPCKSN